MIVTQARIEANRRNAQRSTGPKTPEGKARSRANALTHGLCASVCVPEDAKLVYERSSEFFNTLKPQNDYHSWVVTEIALASLRIDRCERNERRLRDKKSLGAELFWEDDKKLEASLLGEQLGTRPEIVLEQLRRTPQGCEWLMSRWAMLAHVADTKTVWDRAQTELAFDLLGTPREFRDGLQPGASLNFQGKLVETDLSLAAVARREIAELDQRREFVDCLDEANQALAINDHTVDDNDPEMRRLRRYESTLHGRLRWGLKELRYQSPYERPVGWLKNKWLGMDETFKAEPTKAPAPPVSAPLPAMVKIEEPKPPEGPVWLKSPHPPFDLEPEEVPAPGEVADYPKILDNRHEKQLRKVASRREARRRKVDKLRA